MGRGGIEPTEGRKQYDSKSRGIGKMSGQQRRRGGGGGYQSRGGGACYSGVCSGYRRGGGSGSSSNRYKNKLAENMSGFLGSCNMNERDCVKEAFNILNEYVLPSDTAEEKPTEITTDSAPSTTLDSKADEAAAADHEIVSSEDGAGASTSKAEENDDIEAALKAEIKELKSDAVRNKFFSLDTGVPNLIFIKTTVKDPAALAYRILEDISKNKQKKSRFLLRLLPIETTCAANMDRIEATCRKIFPKYFKDSFTSFQIIFKSRYNSKIDRMEVIKMLANLVTEINPLNVVDLTNPKYSIIVEVIKNIVCIGVVTEFNNFKKYNLFEAALSEEEKKLLNESKKPGDNANKNDEAAAAAAVKEEVKAEGVSVAAETEAMVAE